MLSFGRKEPIFDVTLSNGENYLFDTRRNFYVRALEDAPDEDWKTATVHGISYIPKGEEVKVVARLDNFYGRWLQVLYDGCEYSVDPRYFEYVGVRAGEVASI